MTVITPGISKPLPGSRSVGNHVDLASSQYNLRQETTDFLTQLSQGLSDENDALIGLVRDTLSSLRRLQGMPPDPMLQPQNSYESSRSDLANVIMTAPPSYEALASGTEKVMTNLHGLLTNPSFVPLEEVQTRDEEIQKLRGAWEKMEERWREAVALMDSWRKRMEHTGDTINLSDLKMGMDLGTDLPAAPSPSQRIQLPNLESELMQEKVINLEQSAEDLGTYSAKISNDGYGDESVHDAQDIALEQPEPEGNILKIRSGNERPSLIPRKIDFPAIPEENTRAIRDFEDELILDLCNENGGLTTADPTSPNAKEVRNSRLYGKRAELTFMQVRCPLSSPQTIQNKLERARSEAEESRLIQEKKGRRRSGVVKKLRGSRRRSTLSPDELEKLMGLV